MDLSVPWLSWKLAFWLSNYPISLSVTFFSREALFLQRYLPISVSFPRIETWLPGFWELDREGSLGILDIEFEKSLSAWFSVIPIFLHLVSPNPELLYFYFLGGKLSSPTELSTYGTFLIQTLHYGSLFSAHTSFPASAELGDLVSEPFQAHWSSFS